jgi:hypothetical protein
VSDGKSLIGQVGYQVKAAVAKKTPIKVQGVKIFHDKPGGGVEEVQAPKATDRHQYFAVETRGAQTDGAKVTWVITAVDTSKGKNQKVSGVDIDKWPLDDTTITLDIELPGSWPTGKYKLELFVDGASIGAPQLRDQALTRYDEGMGIRDRLAIAPLWIVVSACLGWLSAPSQCRAAPRSQTVAGAAVPGSLR